MIFSFVSDLECCLFIYTFNKRPDNVLAESSFYPTMQQHDYNMCTAVFDRFIHKYIERHIWLGSHELIVLPIYYGLTTSQGLAPICYRRNF